MKLLFKQRFFSWFDSYDAYDEAGHTVFTVGGQPALRHNLYILDARGIHVGTVRQRLFTFLPRFELFAGNRRVGEIVKELSLFSPVFRLEGLGWRMEGNFFEWDYRIFDPSGRTAPTVSKRLWNWADTYEIDIPNPADALPALMAVLAIDAEKCSRDGLSSA